MSSPTKIGFYLRYGWDESTRAACTVADYVSSLGASVTFLSPEPREDEVHSVWDERVTSERRRGFAEWADRCSHLFWVDVPTHLAQHQIADRKNVLLLPWHRLDEEKQKRLKLFHTILCPSHSSYRAMQLAGYGDRSSCAMFDAFGALHTPAASLQKRIFCPIDSYTGRELGVGLLYQLQTLLDSDPEIQITVGYGKSWSSEGVKILTSMLTQHEGRFAAIKRPTWLTRGACYETHELTLDLSLRQTTGLFALESLSYGRPVVTFDVAPMHEIVEIDKTGWRVPCGIKLGTMKTPEAVVNFSDLAATLQHAVNNLESLQTAKHWKLSRRNRQKTFNRALNVALDLL